MRTSRSRPSQRLSTLLLCVLHHVPYMLKQEVIFRPDKCKTNGQIQPAVVQLFESQKLWGPAVVQPMDTAP